MKLYYLYRKTDAKWEENEEVLVLANTSKEARKLVSEAAQEEGKECWLSAKLSACSPVKKKSPHVIMISNKGA